MTDVRFHLPFNIKYNNFSNKVSLSSIRLYLNLIFKNVQFYCIVYSVIIFRNINCTHSLFSPESHDELWEKIGKLQYVSTLLPLVSVHFKNACRRPVECYT